jgi:ribonuclease HI
MTEDVKAPLKAVLYTDGGYRQQYKAGGWGVHGYTYVDEKPTKGTGNPKASPTHNGYAGETTSGEPVTITAYIDGVGGVPDAISNNHTELEATTQALELIDKKGIHEAKIYTDSRYVTDGLSKWVGKWKVNGWKNSEGNPVTGKDLWVRASDLMTKITSEGRTVDISWIKGHNGHFGNEMADYYASMGNVLGRKRDDYTQLSFTEPSGYWSKKIEYNRMLASGRWYFQTTDESYKTPCGKTIYYIGDHGTDDEMVGKRVADTGMVVLYLKEEDAVLEALRKQAMELDKRKFGSIMVGRLDNILNPTVYSDVGKLGTRFLDWDTRRLDIVTAKRKHLLKEMSPPGLAYVAVDTLGSLQRRLDSYLDKDPGTVVTEITDLLYDEESKKSIVVKKLKKDIVQTTKHLTFDVRYSTKRVSELAEVDDPSIKTKSIRLILGQDLVKRNTLSNLGTNDPRVFVITWRESDLAIRFATVVECDLGVGIWAGVDSNFLLV